MKKVFYFILILFLFSTCIYCPLPPDSFLINQTGHDLIVAIHLDTTVSNRYQPKFSWWNLHYFANDKTCFKISIDTVNFIGVYRLRNSESVSIHGGWAKKDKSTMYDYMQIMTFNDTITFNSAEAIDDKLVQRGNDDIYDLIVK